MAVAQIGVRANSYIINAITCCDINRYHVHSVAITFDSINIKQVNLISHNDHVNLSRSGTAKGSIEISGKGRDIPVGDVPMSMAKVCAFFKLANTSTAGGNLMHRGCDRSSPSISVAIPTSSV